MSAATCLVLGNEYFTNSLFKIEMQFINYKPIDYIGYSLNTESISRKQYYFLYNSCHYDRQHELKTERT